MFSFRFKVIIKVDVIDRQQYHISIMVYPPAKYVTMQPNHP